MHHPTAPNYLFCYSFYSAWYETQPSKGTGITRPPNIHESRLITIILGLIYYLQPFISDLVLIQVCLLQA